MIRMFMHRDAKKSRTGNNTEIKELPKSLARFYIKYAFKGNWLLLGIWLLVTSYSRTGTVLVPLTERWFIEMFERPLTGTEQFIAENLPTLLMIVLIYMSYSLTTVLQDMLASRRWTYMERQISETLTDYLHRQSAQFWSEHKTGTVNSQINYVMRGIGVIGECVHILVLAIAIGINVWLMLDVNVWITAIFAFMFVTRLIYTLLMMKPVKNASKADSEANSRLAGHMVDSLSNSYIVRLFAGANTEHQMLDKPRTERIKKRLYSRFVQRMLYAPFAFIWDIGYGIVLLMCLYLFAEGHILLSAAVFSVSVYDRVISAIASLIRTIPQLVDDIASATKAYSELAKPIQIVDKPNATQLVVSHGKIEFRNVSFKYRRKWILRDFNLTIKPGERVGLVGASGAGKTTLVMLLMRFWDVNKGQILIDGVDIRDVTQDSLRRAVGFIPQEPTLFDRTLRDNIAYGAPNATDAEIRRAAKRASADGFIMAAEKKYDSLVGERGIKLSGGQKQRIAIARAFLKNAPILVLDEATSALDSETEVAIQQSFEQLASDRTTIAIAHRLSTLRNMDRIVVMKQGRIIEQGAHNSLLRRKGGEYARLWRMQSGGFIKE